MASAFLKGEENQLHDTVSHTLYHPVHVAGPLTRSVLLTTVVLVDKWLPSTIGPVYLV